MKHALPEQLHIVRPYLKSRVLYLGIVRVNLKDGLGLIRGGSPGGISPEALVGAVEEVYLWLFLILLKSYYNVGLGLFRQIYAHAKRH